MRSTLPFLLPALLLGGTPRAPEVQFIGTRGGFVAHAGNHSIRIQPNGWSVVDDAGHVRGGLQFQRARRSSTLEPLQPNGKFSYFAGRDPQRWIHGATAYARVRQSVYPGVDAVYYGADGKLEYDFIVAPQADPDRIALRWTGPAGPMLNPDGSLTLLADSGALKLAPLVAYQNLGKVRAAVQCRYTVKGRLVRFQVGPYDRSRQLVIDPQLVFSNLIGSGVFQSLTADQYGNLYHASGGSVTKRDKDGNILWSATIGETYSLTSTSVAVDGTGAVYLAGAALQGYFPTTPDAFPVGAMVPVGQFLGFVAKLSAHGSTLLYSTLLGSSRFGGDGVDQVTALAVSRDGNITITGTVFAVRALPLGGSLPFRQPGGFVARLSADGTKVIYATVLHGVPSALAVDSSGDTVVAGSGTQADDAPVSLQPNSADVGAYVSPDDGATVRSSRGATINWGIAVDPTDPLTVLRATVSGVYQSSDGGSTWQFIDRLGTGTYTAVWIHPHKQLWFASSSPGAFGPQTLYRSVDRGTSWQPVSAVGWFSGFSEDGDRILGNNPHANYLNVTQDDGKTWSVLVPGFVAAPVCCAVDPSDPRHFLLGSESVNSRAVLETHDSGASFRVIANVSLVPLAFDPKLANVVYGYRNMAASSGALNFFDPFVKSEDGGRTWRFPSSGHQIPAAQIAVDPSGSGRIYAFGPLGVYRSDDRGETWTQLPGQLGNAPLTGGTAVFGDPDRLYAVGLPQGDGYVSKLDASGSLIFSTLVGGRNTDKVEAVAIASNGDIVIGGTTHSDDLLVAAGAPKRINGGVEQGFLARISSDGAALQAFRYVGGSVLDSITNLAFLSSGEVVAIGTSQSHDEPDITPDAFVPQLSNDGDGFIGVFSADTFVPRYFSFLGRRQAASLAVVGMRAYVTGIVLGPDLASLVCPGNPGAYCNGLLAALDLTP
jgi:hypothetical protein